ncbi:MAG: HAD family hydrolase [Salinisphaeraceae bacterium]|nr:HAD family hydrolase [Salinisphaeraceae bacterium]
MKNIKGYSTLVFDCDGVILNSNSVKTEALRQTAAQYGQTAADNLVAYHKMHGGVSRYLKFDYLFREILAVSVDSAEVARLAEEFGSEVRDKLMTCEIASGLYKLRDFTADAKWMVVSGGNQEELREIFKAREISKLFDGGIFGSPDPKEKILAREMKSGNLVLPAVFIGDSEYDENAASGAGIDFIFLSGWSELFGWERFVQAHGLETHERLIDLLGTC